MESRRGKKSRRALTRKVMNSALHFILLFSAGLWALSLSTSHRFYIMEKETKTWDEAQKYCRDEYTDLATIENQEDMNAVQNLLRGKKDNFWIGLRQNLTAWKSYSKVSWFWSDGAPYNYSNWNYGEPNDGNDGKNCVEIYPDRTWNDAGCDQGKKIVCYKKRTPPIVIEDKKTWRDALEFCRRNHVDLVSVYSQEIQDWLEQVIQNVSTNVTSMWIGLRHTCALGFWYWVKGETICYQNWAPGNGTGVEDCAGGERTGAMLSGSKEWISLPETQQLPFICITF